MPPVTKKFPSGENETHETLQATELEANFLPRLEFGWPVGVPTGVLPFLLGALVRPLKSHTETTLSEPTVTRRPKTLDTA